MAFDEDLNRFVLKLERRTRAVFHGSTDEVQRSIRDGSEITAALGQPVDTGNLKGSWIPEQLSDVTWQTTTGVVYAPSIEEGIQAPYVRNGAQITPRPIQFKSAVGGAHSVKMTRAGWSLIVDAVRNRVVGADG